MRSIDWYHDNVSASALTTPQHRDTTMSMRTCSLLLTACFLAVVAACGGSKQKGTDAPTPATSASPSKTDADKPAEKTAKPAESKPDKKPRDVISDPETTFVLAFDSSEPGKAAEPKCTASSKGDNKKFNQCMATARDKIAVDAMRFKQDDEQNWWWQSLRRRGGSETVLHKVQFDWGDETDTSVVIKPKGRDVGTTPWGKVPTEYKIDVPTTFSISVKDPQHGTLTYEAKIVLNSEKK